MSSDPDPLSYPDFSNTEIAFRNKNNRELKEVERLFSAMNNLSLVNMGSRIAKLALKMRLPLVEKIIQKTVFKQFCGGLNLLDCQEVIDDLYKNNVLSLLDYGVEGKSEEEDLDHSLEELINAIDFAASNHSVPAAICKLTALVDNSILEKKQSDEAFSLEEQNLFDRFYNRVKSACSRAHELGVGLLIDAEESWMQDAMDEVVTDMMQLFNKDNVIVYNTYQMYRKDRLAKLKLDFDHSVKDDYLIGAKIVRGAYMQKERERAQEMGYESPIHNSKEETDHDFDRAIRFCIDNYEKISFICASHNVKSNQLLSSAIIKEGIPLDHKHINFSQLQGMSDYITFNLAKFGFNVAKYVVYGPVKEVTEFLIRRAQENTSITGEASRELQLIRTELKRRNN